MKRKTVAIVLSTILAISALGGCGSSTPANVETEKRRKARRRAGRAPHRQKALFRLPL